MPLDLNDPVIETLAPLNLQPGNFKLAGLTLAERLKLRYAPLAAVCQVTAATNFYPSECLLSQIAGTDRSCSVKDAEGETLLQVLRPDSADAEVLTVDEGSLVIRFPWDFLTLNEQIVGSLTANEICGTVRERVTIDGFIHLGKGSVILPGVYIEGNAYFGENCKIGPNCYIRGTTSTGDNCHIGQAVEIKNSVFGFKVSVGHLSYVGDTVIADRVNFGAGTIISNLRHDGKNHRFSVPGKLYPTNRRKFGAIIGEGVHTGIHTSIYPGRSLSAGSTTLPGEVVSHAK